MVSLREILGLGSILSVAVAQDTIYAVYIFHRHGDRTPKSLAPTNLTTLGYDQVISSGTFYHNRYVDSNSPNHIVGLSSSIVKNSQLSVSAPLDTVLQNSAQGFLQGLYPPVSTQTETLANGTTISPPMNGYQLIPVSMVDAGTGSEDNGWLQDASGCNNAKISSNNYLSSKDYKDLLASTKDFYTRLSPVVNQTFASDYMTFKNAYTIFDLINVARIHNRTIPSGSLLDDPTVSELQLLANQHEYGLAFNSSDNARSVPGMQLAGEILSFLQKSVSSKGSSKLGVQFGAYASFLSFFGLAGLPSANPNFTGIPDYASSMTFELFTSGTNSSGFPSADDLKVRFFFSNGSTGILGAPQPYPLFGGNAASVSWSDFSSKMSAFGIESTQKWCQVCGNSTGVCAAYGATGGQNGTANSTSGGHGMSNAVAGVIGAMVTLAVILGLEALIALIAGLRVVKKGRTPMGENGNGVKA